jgi:hypothetical protein
MRLPYRRLRQNENQHRLVTPVGLGPGAFVVICTYQLGALSI